MILTLLSVLASNIYGWASEPTFTFSSQQIYKTYLEDNVFNLDTQEQTIAAKIPNFSFFLHNVNRNFRIQFYTYNKILDEEGVTTAERTFVPAVYC